MSSDSSYPFHTDTVDGSEVCGVLYDADAEEWLEFIQPDIMEAFAAYRNPRTGEITEFSTDTELEREMAAERYHGGRVVASAWSRFRRQYVDAEDPSRDDIEDLIHPESPLDAVLPSESRVVVA